MQNLSQTGCRKRQLFEAGIINVDAVMKTHCKSGGCNRQQRLKTELIEHSKAQ
ncbi:MAG: hypothetical protein ABFD18_01085 [Syntrophomonas sp.]